MAYFEPAFLSKWMKVQRCRLWFKRRLLFSGNAEELEIRPVDEKDIRRLKKMIHHSHGRTLQDELKDQREGRISFVVSWKDKVPYGYSFVSWEGARDIEVRHQLPGVPEFYRLTVVESARSKGIGTALIQFIEQMARKRGFTKMGLGVAHTNLRAQALYERLGYETVVQEYCDRYHFTDSAGQVREAADKCRFMVKDL
jgi:GNAT superfamily N-acetyltransferase